MRPDYGELVKEVPAEVLLDNTEAGRCAALARAAWSFCGRPGVPLVRFFAPVSHPVHAMTKVFGLRVGPAVWLDVKSAAYYDTRYPDTMWIRYGRLGEVGEYRAAVSFGHEAKHADQHATGRPFDEAEAEAAGRRFAAEYVAERGR